MSTKAKGAPSSGGRGKQQPAKKANPTEKKTAAAENPKQQPKKEVGNNNNKRDNATNTNTGKGRGKGANGNENGVKPHAAPAGKIENTEESGSRRPRGGRDRGTRSQGSGPGSGQKFRVEVDDAVEREQIEKLSAEIDATHRRLEQSREKINEHEEALKKFKQERDELIQLKKTSFEKKAAAQQAQNQRTLDAIEGKRLSAKKKEQATILLNQLPIKNAKGGGDLAAANLKYIDDQVTLLKKKIATCKTPGEDKKFSNEVKNWGVKRTIALKYDQLIKESRKEEDRSVYSDKTRTKEDEEITACLANVKTANTKLDAMKGQQDKIMALLTPLRDERNALRDELTRLKDERSKVFDKIKEKTRVAREEEMRKRKQAKEEEDLKREQAKQEALKAAEERKKKELLIPPFTKDIKGCDKLANLLRNKAKNNKAAEGEEEPTLRLALSTLILFEKLSLEAPTKFDEISGAIERIGARKAYLAGLSNETMISRGLEPAFEEDGTEKGKKKSAPKGEEGEKGAKKQKADKNADKPAKETKTEAKPEDKPAEKVEEKPVEKTEEKVEEKTEEKAAESTEQTEPAPEAKTEEPAEPQQD